MTDTTTLPIEIRLPGEHHDDEYADAILDDMRRPAPRSWTRALGSLATTASNSAREVLIAFTPGLTSTGALADALHRQHHEAMKRQPGPFYLRIRAGAVVHPHCIDAGDAARRSAIGERRRAYALA